MSGAESRGLYLDPPQNAAVVSLDEKSHLLLQVRTRVLNYQLASDFHRRYPRLGRTPDPYRSPRSLPHFVPLSINSADPAVRHLAVILALAPTVIAVLAGLYLAVAW